MARFVRALLVTLLVVPAVVLTSDTASAATHRWNFQSSGASVPAGYNPDSGDAFSSSRGYGWNLTDGKSRQCGDRNAIADQVRDTFCHAQTLYEKVGGKWQAIDSPASWRAAVANGTYTVTVILGESKHHPSSVRHSAQVEGVVFATRVQTTSSSPFVEVTKSVSVADGSLDVTFDGGSKTKIVAVVATSSDGTSSSSTSPSSSTSSTAATTTTTSGGSSPASGKWNFQSDDASVPTGYLEDAGLLYSSARGYGWSPVDGTVRRCDDRDVLTDQVRDTFCHAQTHYEFNGSSWDVIDSPATWKAALANGNYSVKVIVGEASVHNNKTEHSVQVEGVSFVDQVTTTSSDPFVEVTKVVSVAGGFLDVTFNGGSRTKIVAVTASPSSSTTTTTAPSTTTTVPSTTTTTKATTTTTAAPPPPGGSSLVFYDNRATTDGTKYNRNNDYVMPVKDLTPYSFKAATMKITVFSKKSSLNTPMQICAWQRGPNGEWKGKGTDETCSPLRGTITSNGTYTFSLPKPADWWAVSGRGNYDWSEQTDAVGIMVKDGTNTKYLMMYQNCGAACHPKGESYVKQHVPIDFRAEITFFK